MIHHTHPGYGTNTPGVLDTPGGLACLTMAPGVQNDLPYPRYGMTHYTFPGVGRTSCVAGHKTSAASRPCISKTITWRSLKSRNHRNIASKTSHSTASGSVSASERHDQISSESSKQRSVQRLKFQQSYSLWPYTTPSFRKICVLTNRGMIGQVQL